MHSLNQVGHLHAAMLEGMRLTLNCSLEFSGPCIAFWTPYMFCGIPLKSHQLLILMGTFAASLSRELARESRRQGCARVHVYLSFAELRRGCSPGLAHAESFTGSACPPSPEDYFHAKRNFAEPSPPSPFLAAPESYPEPSPWERLNRVRCLTPPQGVKDSLLWCTLSGVCWVGLALFGHTETRLVVHVGSFWV